MNDLLRLQERKTDCQITISPLTLGISSETIIRLLNQKLVLWFEEDDGQRVCLHCRQRIIHGTFTVRPIYRMIYHIAIHEREGWLAPQVRHDDLTMRRE